MGGEVRLTIGIVKREIRTGLLMGTDEHTDVSNRGRRTEGNRQQGRMVGTGESHNLLRRTNKWMKAWTDEWTGRACGRGVEEKRRGRVSSTGICDYWSTWMSTVEK